MHVNYKFCLISKNIKKYLFVYFAYSILFCLKLFSSQSLEEDLVDWKTLLATTPFEKMEVVLGGGINKTYKFNHRDQDYIIRVGTQELDKLRINREREITFHQIGILLDVSPRIYYSDLKQGILVTQYIRGSIPISNDQNTLTDIIQTLKKIHTYKKKRSQSFGIYYLSNIESFLTVAKSKNDPQLQALYSGISLAEEYSQKIPEDKVLVASHNDFSTRNLIKTEKKIWVIDWEFSDWGSPYNDLASFAMDERLDDDQQRTMLKSYFGQSYQNHLQNFKFTCALYSLRFSAWAFSKLQNEQEDEYRNDFEIFTKHHLQKFQEIFSSLGCVDKKII